ncbi:MAG: hypothetical protein AAGC97_13660 [Planctomycetota bacterium]
MMAMVVVAVIVMAVVAVIVVVVAVIVIAVIVITVMMFAIVVNVVKTPMFRVGVMFMAVSPVGECQVLTNLGGSIGQVAGPMRRNEVIVCKV